MNMIVVPLHMTEYEDVNHIADMNPQTLVYGVSSQFWNAVMSQHPRVCTEVSPHVHLRDDKP